MAYEYDGAMADTQQVGDRANFNDAALAGTPSTAKRILVLCPLEASGTANDGDLIANVAGPDEAETYFGLLARHAFELARQINPGARIDCLAVAEATGTPATASFTFTENAAADDTVTAKLGTYEVDFSITKDDTPAEQATALAAAITADATCPWSGAADSAAVNLTAPYDGTICNSHRIALEDNGGLGVVTIVQPHGGATDPDLSDYTDTFKDLNYRIVVNPWTGSDNAAHLKDIADYMLAGGQTGGAMFIQYLKDTYSNHITWCQTQQHWAFMAALLTEDENWLIDCFTAALIEAGYHALQSDPSVPFIKQRRRFFAPYTGGTALTGTQKELLLRGGGSFVELNEDGYAQMHIAVTTATKLSTGVESYAKSSVHVFYTAVELRRLILADLAANNDTPAKRKMTDGKVGDIRGCVLSSLEKAASPAYQWLSKTKLDEVKGDIVIKRSTTNLHRTEGGPAAPIVQDHRGNDLTINLVQA